jgi:esterase/lipase superfamily enzyme
MNRIKDTEGIIITQAELRRYQESEGPIAIAKAALKAVEDKYGFEKLDKSIKEKLSKGATIESGALTALTIDGRRSPSYKNAWEDVIDRHDLDKAKEQEVLDKEHTKPAKKLVVCRSKYLKQDIVAEFTIRGK